MAVTVTTNKVRADGDGVVTAFTFTFKVFKAADLEVYKVDAAGVTTLQTITTDYTVSINTVTEGGTVTYIVAPTNVQESFIRRILEFTQPTVIPTESNFPEKAVENEFDRSRMLDIQAQEERTRLIQFGVASTTTGVTIPEPEAGKVLAWNSAGDDLTNALNPDTAADEAAVSAAAAAVSAAAALASESAAAASAVAAAASAVAAAASAATVNLPTITSGDATKIVKVNAGETGYEFDAKMPDMSAGTAGDTLKLNSGKDGYELQSEVSFHVLNSGAQNNLTTLDDIVLDNERYDVGNNFASNTFTAPVTRKYQINVEMTLTNIDSAATHYGMQITASNGNFTVFIDPRQFAGDIAGRWSIVQSHLVDMDANDTLTVKFVQSGGTGQTDIANGADAAISGFLVK